MKSEGLDYKIDKLDHQILSALRKDARCSFLDLSKKLKVSSGTIHQRVNKMQASGIIQSFSVELSAEKLGFVVTALVGIYLNNARDAHDILAKIEKFSEVTEAYYTTGTYAAIIKAQVRSIADLQNFLSNKLQSLQQIRSTESYVVLSTAFRRSVM